MNPDTGVIRELPAGEDPAPAELAVSELEAKVLARYVPTLRPELLRRWRAGAYRVAMTSNGPELVEVVDPAKAKERARIANTVATWKAKKARRRAAAISRSKNRRRAR